MEALLLPDDQSWNPVDYRWHPHDLVASRSRLGQALPSAETCYLTDNGGLDGRTLVLQTENLPESQLSRKNITCQVCGCGKNLENEKSYYKRYRLCEDHLKMLSLVVDGRPSRFCQQCGRFHPLSEFDGDKRSCRARLQEHNARRRKKQPVRENTKASAAKRQQRRLPESKTSSGTDATRTSSKRARTSEEQGGKNDKRNNSEDSTCQMETEDEDSELLLEAATALNPTAAAGTSNEGSPQAEHIDTTMLFPPRAASTKSELFHMELALASSSPEATACIQHHPQLLHSGSVDKAHTFQPATNCHTDCGVPLHLSARCSSSLAPRAGLLNNSEPGHRNSGSLGINGSDILEGLDSCDMNNMLDEVMARGVDGGRLSKAGPLDQLQLHTSADLTNLRGLRAQQYQAANGLLHPHALNHLTSNQSAQQHQYQTSSSLSDSLARGSNIPMPDLLQAQFMPYQPMQHGQHGHSHAPLAATSEARQMRELLMEMTVPPKEQSLLERAHALQALRLQAMSAVHDFKVEDGSLLHNDMPPDLSTLLNLNLGRGRPDLGLGLAELHLNTSAQLPPQRATSLSPEWGLGQQSTLEITKSILSGGGLQAHYQSHDTLTRLSIKMANCTPDQLNPNFRNYLMTTLNPDSTVLHGCIKPGCVHITLDVSSPASRGCPVQPAALAGGLCPGLLANRKVLMQVGSAVALFDDGALVYQGRAVAPKLQRLEPLAVQPGVPTTLTLHGSQVCEEGVVVTARFQGQVVPVVVVESVVEDKALGLGRLVVQVPPLPRSGVLLVECLQGTYLSNCRAVLVAEEQQIVREVEQLLAEVASGRMSFDMAEQVALDLGRILEFDDLAAAQLSVLAAYHEQATQLAGGRFVKWQRPEPKGGAGAGDTSRKGIAEEGEESSDSGCDDIPPELAVPPHPLLTEPYRSSVLRTVEALLPFACELGWASTASRLVGVLLSQGFKLEAMLQAGRDGLSLLHRCVRSCQVAMVQEALEWTSGTPLVEHWGMISAIGVSPLHLAAAAPNRALVGAAILSSSLAACYLWLVQQAADGLSPADLSAQLGNPGLNNFAWHRLMHAKAAQQAADVAAAADQPAAAAPGAAAAGAQQRTEVNPDSLPQEKAAGSSRQHREAVGKADKAAMRAAMPDGSKLNDDGAGPSGSAAARGAPLESVREEPGAGPSSSAHAELSEDLPEDYEEEEDDDCCKGSAAKDDKAQQTADLELLALGSYGLGPVGMAYLVCFLTMSAVLLVCQLLLSSWGTFLLAIALTLFQAALALRLPFVEKCRLGMGRLREDLTAALGNYLPAFSDQQLEALYIRSMAGSLVQMDLVGSAVLLALDLVVLAKWSGSTSCTWLTQLTQLGQDWLSELSWLPGLLPHAMIWLCTLCTLAATTQRWYVVKREQLMLVFQVLMMLAVRAMAAEGLTACWQRGALLFLAALLLPVAFRVRVRSQVWIAGWALASSIMAAAIADASGLALLLKVAVTTFGSAGITYMLERNDRVEFLSKHGAAKLPCRRTAAHHEHSD